MPQARRRNRWYDPNSGRFLTQDPIGLAGGVNLYAYAGGNPVSFSDPFGLFDVTVEGEQSRKVVAYMMANSASFRKLYNDLDQDHNVHLVIRDPVGPGEKYLPNQFDAGKNGSGQIFFNPIDVNQSNYDKAVKGKTNWIYTDGNVMGHELGHAGGFFGKGGLSPSCAGDPKAGATGGCILNWDNKVRRDLGPAGGGKRTEY